MFKVTYEYSGKSFELNPYITLQEKDLLLLSMLEQDTLDNALEICKIDKETIQTLSENEKKAMLLKLREISIGGEMNVKFKCRSCGNGNENTISISNIIENPGIKDERIKDKFSIVTEDNIQEFVDFNIDDLDFDEYEKLLEIAKQTQTKFNFACPVYCQKCQTLNRVDISNEKFILENMSEDTLMGLYQTYSDLSFFSHYTKQDVDSLYPFERTILISLLNKTREEFIK